MKLAMWLWILDEIGCISLHANALSMNLSVFSLKIRVNSTIDYFFSFSKVTSLGERKPWIQSSLAPLKNWPRVTSLPYCKHKQENALRD